jgi:hypothetical protein
VNRTPHSSSPYHIGELSGAFSSGDPVLSVSMRSELVPVRSGCACGQRSALCAFSRGPISGRNMRPGLLAASTGSLAPAPLQRRQPPVASPPKVPIHVILVHSNPYGQSTWRRARRRTRKTSSYCRFSNSEPTASSWFSSALLPSPAKKAYSREDSAERRSQGDTLVPRNPLDRVAANDLIRERIPIVLRKPA